MGKLGKKPGCSRMNQVTPLPHARTRSPLIAFQGVNHSFGSRPILQDINFVQYQFLLYGLALVLMMLFRPEGLFPSQRRKRELHASDAGDIEAQSTDLLDEAVT